MRLVILCAVAAILTPAVLSAHPVSAPGASAPAATDLSAARKKRKKPAAPREENMKSAPMPETKSSY